MPGGPSATAPAPAQESSPEKVKTISKGKAYSKADYLVPGYVVMLDFYADW